jgi:uncharacterized membrane protein
MCERFRRKRQMAEVLYGPIQMIAIGFDEPEFHGRILRELRAVSEKDIIRVIDLIFVWKDEEGNVTEMEASDLSDEERIRFGAVVGALVGFGARGEEGARVGAEAGAMAMAENEYGVSEEDIREVADSIPVNSAAALLLIEHRWAIRFKEAIRDAGGFLIASGMLTPEVLALYGAELAAAVEAANREEKQRVAAPAR